jgi:hypothetical protein
LLILFALLVLGVEGKSPTADEQNHMARGLAYLKTGDLRLSQEHPPGVNAWSAWPLLLDHRIHLPLESQSWADAEWYGFADELLWRANDHPQQMIFATRVPIMWLTVLLAALVYRWARDLGGPWASAITLALLALDPNLLAHGRLTTTDAGVTCTAVATMYTLWRALRAPQQSRRWVVAGLALGAALLSKFSALLLVPVVLIVVLLAGLRGRRRSVDPRPDGDQHIPDLEGFPKPSRSILGLVALFGVAALTVWAGYAFSWGPIDALGDLHGPAPAFWAGIQSVLRRTGQGSPAFLLGQVSDEGWWYYFFVAFAVKTPLPTMLALGVALGMWGIGKLRVRPDVGGGLGTGQAGIIGATIPPCPLCLILPALAFWAIALAGSFNIGYRHILASLPFLYILGGWGIWKPGMRGFGNWGLDKPGRLGFQLGNSPALYLLPAILLLWLAVETLAIAPHYLAYFNQIVGGPSQGYRVLVDSNLDWGQDLPGLKEYAEREGIERIHLSWFGAAYPEAYDLTFHPLPGFWRFGGEAAAYGFNPYAPAPGVYAISATNLWSVKLSDSEVYAWFREREPDAQVGYSIQIYRVTAEETATLGEAAALAVPRAQLAAEEAALLQGISSVRHYDPQTGIIVPAQATTLWYVSAQPPLWSEPVRQGPGYVVARGSPPPTPNAGGEASFGGFVAPLGDPHVNSSALQDGTLTVTIHWQVSQPPHRAAVSFVHLLDVEGRYVAGWDGLTAPATCWQAGDWIEQHYPVSLPKDLKPGTYPIEVGWYDADTGERWRYVVKGETVGDRMLIERELGGDGG